MSEVGLFLCASSENSALICLKMDLFLAGTAEAPYFLKLFISSFSKRLEAKWAAKTTAVVHSRAISVALFCFPLAGFLVGVPVLFLFFPLISPNIWYNFLLFEHLSEKNLNTSLKKIVRLAQQSSEKFG